MEKRTDTELMLLVKEGDMHAFELLTRKHRPGLINFLTLTVHNVAIAEELAQEVFLRVYRARDRYEPTARFTTWLFRIGTNVALNWLRDERKDRMNESLDHHSSDAAPRFIRDEQPIVEEVLVRNASSGEIKKAILQLPKRQCQVVLMHKFEDLEYKQIASRMGTSPQAVKSLLFRAYDQLRGSLAHLAPLDEAA